MIWTIDEMLDGERLDQALVRLDPSGSRAQWQKRIKEQTVLIDGKPASSAHVLLKTNERVEWRPAPERSLADRTPSNPPPALRIIAETPDWLVVDKHAGLLVHPVASSPDEPTLVDALLIHDPKIAKVGAEPERPGIIHRLDRDVSGLMVVAKTQAAYDDLQTQFRERRIDKTYLALVHGTVAKDDGDIRFTLARSTTQGRMAARPEHDGGGKAAWTHYTVLERVPGATLLKVQIYSGRTHQIRAHLFALGHPVFGDVLYVKKQTDRHKNAPRLMLQSVQLSFSDPATKEKQTFSLEADAAFERLLKAWRVTD